MGYVATKSRPRYLDTDLKAEFAGDNPDYFDVKTNKWYSTSSGSELVTNGKFTDGTTGWTIGGTITPTVSNSTIKLTTETIDGYIYQYLPTVIGKKYKIKATSYSSGWTTLVVYQSVTKGVNFIGGIVSGILDITFIASSTSTPILFTVGVAAGYVIIDNISIYESDLTIGSELTPRNYLNNIVYADHNGQPEYVEEVAKVEYKDSMKLNKLSVTEGFDLGQTWQNVTASRSLGVTYTNTTGKPIVVCIVGGHSAVGSATFLINSTIVKSIPNISGVPIKYNFDNIIPNNATYSIGGVADIATWFELR